MAFCVATPSQDTRWRVEYTAHQLSGRETEPDYLLQEEGTLTTKRRWQMRTVNMWKRRRHQLRQNLLEEEVQSYAQDPTDSVLTEFLLQRKTVKIRAMMYKTHIQHNTTQKGTQLGIRSQVARDCDVLDTLICSTYTKLLRHTLGTKITINYATNTSLVPIAADCCSCIICSCLYIQMQDLQIKNTMNLTYVCMYVHTCTHTTKFTCDERF